MHHFQVVVKMVQVDLLQIHTYFFCGGARGNAGLIWSLYPADAAVAAPVRIEAHLRW